MSKFRLLPFSILCWLVLGTVSAEAAPANLATGVLEGAPFLAWVPDAPGEILLILAPGYRPEDASREARLNTDEPVYQHWHQAGWSIAATAYRKNGWAVNEGMEDVVNLARHLSDEYGPFRLVLVQGESMGGLIVLKLMEHPEWSALFHGGLALGAALGADPQRVEDLGGTSDDLEVSFKPLRPVLFVSNRNELAGPLSYLAQVSASPYFRRVAVHSVERRGHVNLTSGERKLSLQRLHHWAEGEPPPRLMDATVEVPQTVSSGTLSEAGVLTRVQRVDPDFGNLDLDATFSDLQSLGLDFGSIIAIRAQGEIRQARIGDRYAAVPRDEWVVVVLPDGGLRAAINFGNAAADLGLLAGDPVELILLD